MNEVSTFVEELKSWFVKNAPEMDFSTVNTVVASDDISDLECEVENKQERIDELERTLSTIGDEVRDVE